jgi:purine-nucleoside phosphorylase
MTPHNEAKENEIAKTVIMPGDPLRAKYIADKFLDNAKLVNQVRNMYAYTGTYKGKKLTIMASGMGMPSMGIYSYELFKFYNVENIIRIGTAGSYVKELNIYDMFLVEKAYSESSYALTQNGETKNILESNKELNDIIINTAKELNMNLQVGTVHSSDVFYKENDNYLELVEKYDTKAVEMESFALFHNANVLGKKATCLLTISDSFITKEETTSEERQTHFNDMMKLALEAALKL